MGDLTFVTLTFATTEWARSVSDEALAELVALHDILVASGLQRDQFFPTNERFHLPLLSLPGNRWRQQFMLDLRKMMKLNRHHSLLCNGRIAESLAEHEVVMAALRAGGGDRVNLTRRTGPIAMGCVEGMNAFAAKQ
jgi:DNA-binding GntR family transcriptional regulator